MFGDSYPFALMDNEEVILETRPHLLSMVGLMLFWIALAVMGVLFIVYYHDLKGLFNDYLKYDFLDFLSNKAYGAVWVAAILLPLVVMAIFRINFKYVVVLLLLLAARFFIWWKGREMLGIPEDPHPHIENYMLIAVGVIGAVGVEIFRRGHRYYVTNMRILYRFGSLMKSERSTLYSKIDDLILQQGILGGIFNFGTVIPITSTGLGMGQDMAIAGAGVGGGKAGAAAGLFAAGGKSQNVPRELSMYVLYKVPYPEEARDMVLEEMAAREAPRNGYGPTATDDALDDETTY